MPSMSLNLSPHLWGLRGISGYILRGAGYQWTACDPAGEWNAPRERAVVKRDQDQETRESQVEIARECPSPEVRLPEIPGEG